MEKNRTSFEDRGFIVFIAPTVDGCLLLRSKPEDFARGALADETSQRLVAPTKSPTLRPTESSRLIGRPASAIIYPNHAEKHYYPIILTGFFHRNLQPITMSTQHGIRWRNRPSPRPTPSRERLECRWLAIAVGRNGGGPREGHFSGFVANCRLTAAVPTAVVIVVWNSPTLRVSGYPIPASKSSAESCDPQISPLALSPVQARFAPAEEVNRSR
jgi:hypothetical protein